MSGGGDEAIARRAVATGKVQGVLFRDSTQRVARGVGVFGWVRNLTDGSVEAHLEGRPDAVRHVLDFLEQGPPGAQVEDLDVWKVPPEGFLDFAVR